MLGFKKRYAPAYRFLKESEAEWGPPRMGLCRYQLGPVPKDWFWDEADGGGPLVENTAHCLDVLRYLFGDAETRLRRGWRHSPPGATPSRRLPARSASAAARR